MGVFWHASCKKSVAHTQAAMSTPAPTSIASTEAPFCDTSLRFVRVLERRADGLVSFEFSIGWPELAVELMLPATAFEAFCDNNKVTRLDS